MRLYRPNDAKLGLIVIRGLFQGGQVLQRGLFFWVISVSRSYLVGYFVCGVMIHGPNLTNLQNETRYVFKNYCFSEENSEFLL